ncbi:bifunctional diaminohydroxyphosphoribosylaminopyrimidine deaminase/5-amino-6-(5-phosphoribosylamino)uracil reductase RibD [bacterium SCSIO 12741]|nr:bifunctional diaminohydroxyphosphoribosylaminopyrimidine deaminase/5-amino-6-(5-phosphoribosylamino)uracil reductase RibD [bacterium SCSIO 12741]
MGTDEQYMKRCFELASNGLGQVSPNPLVGCVVVRKGKIIGEGYHRQYGGPHAEPNAIRSVSHNEWLKESTLYVNLEPCAHHGKTPPCADLIIASQIPRVVISVKDPFPLVKGRGIEKLIQAGVEVKTGVLEKEGEFLNRRFLTFHRKQRPYILLKWAQTADGFMDRIKSDKKHKPLKISNKTNSTLVHTWRSQEDAICVGRKTVEADNPSLTVRYVTGSQPVRIILGRNVKPDQSRAVLDDSVKTLVYNQNLEEVQGNTHWIKVTSEESFLSEVLTDLYQKGIQSVLVEGGAQLHHSFLGTDLWDEIRITTSDQYIGEGVAAPTVNQNYQDEFATGSGNKVGIIYRDSP